MQIQIHDGKKPNQKIHEFKEFQFGWLPCTNVMSGPSDTDGCY